MSRLPTFSDQVLFQAKAGCLRMIRIARDVAAPSGPQKWPLSRESPTGERLAESRSPLWDPTAPHAERLLQAGKVQNLRVASRRIDGCRVPAGGRFSFWKQVGWPGRVRGYVRGRELRQGCLIPSVAGGLCQLSNALYDVALLAGMTIHERHRHSQIVPGSLAAIDRDATVFWNYVDLQFSAPHPFQIGVQMTADEMIVHLWRLDENAG